MDVLKTTNTSLTSGCYENYSILYKPSQEMFSDERFIPFTEFISISCSCLALAGILGNILVIKTFLLMGVKDGVTLSFLFLSISDLLYLFTVTASSVSLWFYAKEKKHRYKEWFAVDPFSIYVLSANAGVMLYLFTVLDTTFIAVKRCMAVARPLKYRTMFNKLRSSIILFIFTVITVATYLPLFLKMKFVTECDRNINATRTVLWFPWKMSNTYLVKLYIWIFRDVCVTLLTQFIIIISVIIMMRGLKKVSRFRQRSSESRNPENSEADMTNSAIEIARVITPTISVKPNNLSTPDVTNTSSISTTHNKLTTPTIAATPSNLTSAMKGKTYVHSLCDKMTTKEVLIAKQVVLISVIYIVANIPKIVLDVMTTVNPDFSVSGKNHNLYFSSINTMELFQSINSSLNIIIYCKFNSKFRKHLKLLLRN